MSQKASLIRGSFERIETLDGYIDTKVLDEFVNGISNLYGQIVLDETEPTITGEANTLFVARGSVSYYDYLLE